MNNDISDLLQQLKNLCEKKPPSEEQISQLLEIALSSLKVSTANPHYGIWSGLTSNHRFYKHVEIRRPNSGIGSVLVILQPNAQYQLTSKMIMANYKGLPVVTPPSPTQLEDRLIEYSYELSGGEISYGFSESNPELVSRIVVTYKIYVK